MGIEYIEILNDYEACLNDELRTYSANDPMFNYYIYQIQTVEMIKNRIYDQPYTSLDDILYWMIVEVEKYMRRTTTDAEREIYSAMYEVLTLVEDTKLYTE